MLIMQMVPPKLPENFFSLQRMAARQVHFQAEEQGTGPKPWPKLGLSSTVAPGDRLGREAISVNILSGRPPNLG